MFVIGQKVVNGVGDEGIVISIDMTGMMAFPIEVDYETFTDHYTQDGKYYGCDSQPSEFDITGYVGIISSQ